MLYNLEVGGLDVLVARPWDSCVMWVDACLDRYEIEYQKNGEAKVLNCDYEYFCRIYPCIVAQEDNT